MFSHRPSFFRSIFLNFRYFSNLSLEMKQLNDRRQYRQVLDLFERNSNRIRSAQVICQALKACSHLKDLRSGMNIHKIISSSQLADQQILVSLINLYVECGNLPRAQQIFDGVKEKTLFMYGTMMKGFIKNNMSHKAIELFKQIPKPDAIVTMYLFNACAQLGTVKALELASRVFKEMSTNVRKDHYIISSAFDMFIKCKDITNAENLFNQMSRSVISYGNLMKVYSEMKMPQKIFSLYEQMKRENLRADLVTYILLLDACSQMSIRPICERYVAEIPGHYCDHLFIQTSLIDMWGKAGDVNKAKAIFIRIQNPDVKTFTAMINAYAVNGMGLQAIELYRQMPRELINEFTHVCVLSACSHSGLVHEAQSIFNQIETKTEKIYTTMIDCFARSFLIDDAQKLIKEFEKHHSPDIVMHTALLSAARNSRNIELAEKTFDRMQQLFPQHKNDLMIGSILLGNTLASSGDYDKASAIRKRLRHTNLKKQAGLTWTSIDGTLVEFRAHDRSHPQTSEIYAELDRITAEIRDQGYQHDPSWIIRELSEDDTVESILCGHSERLAIAFNLIQKTVPSPIHIIKNLRICGDCHRVTKLIAQIRRCEIIVRDANRIHHFSSDGQCSCQDHF